jgi:hypothetical protein
LSTALHLPLNVFSLTVGTFPFSQFGAVRIDGHWHLPSSCHWVDSFFFNRITQFPAHESQEETRIRFVRQFYFPFVEMARLFVQIVLQGTNLLPCSLWHCQRNLPSGISALPIFKKRLIIFTLKRLRCRHSTANRKGFYLHKVLYACQPYIEFFSPLACAVYLNRWSGIVTDTWIWFPFRLSWVFTSPS